MGRQAHSAARDENAVIFTKAQQAEFEVFRTEVENSTAETTLANGDPSKCGLPDAVPSSWMEPFPIYRR